MFYCFSTLCSSNRCSNTSSSSQLQKKPTMLFLTSNFLLVSLYPMLSSSHYFLTRPYFPFPYLISLLHSLLFPSLDSVPPHQCYTSD